MNAEFLGYLRTLGLKFPKVRTKIETETANRADWTTSILLKYPRNCSFQHSFIPLSLKNHVSINTIHVVVNVVLRSKKIYFLDLMPLHIFLSECTRSSKDSLLEHLFFHYFRNPVQFSSVQFA